VPSPTDGRAFTEHVARRLVLAVPLLFVVSALTFVVVSFIPGNPAVRILGASATPQADAAVDRELGLDQPLVVQYWQWLDHLFHGSLGMSLFDNEPVATLLNQRLGVTLALVVGATGVACIAGVAIGTVAAIRRGPLRWAVDALTLAGFAIPAFWLGYILVSLFAVHWRLLPASGFVPFSQSPAQWLDSLVLPVLTLAAAGTTAIGKQTRDSMLEVLDREFITALRADGIPERSVILRHALRNAALPILTMAGLLFVATLSTSVLVEQVFVLPGLGGLAVSAASNHDLPVIEGVVLYFTVMVIVVNILIDLAYSWLDPRTGAR
jgi:peptide/nickel transport system permease protein